MRISVWPRIRSCDIFPNGDVILCDSDDEEGHGLIMLFSGTFVYIGCLFLETEPRDVAVISSREAIVAMSSKLQFIQVTSSLKAHLAIEFDKQCYAVTFANGDIYTTLSANGGRLYFSITDFPRTADKISSQGGGECHILDLKGTAIRKFVLTTDGILTRIIVNPRSEKIYTTHRDSGKVTCYCL